MSIVNANLVSGWAAEFHEEKGLTSMSQKLRRVLLLVGVVESGVLVPVVELLPEGWLKVMGEGLLLNTREPVRCLGLSFNSLTSDNGINSPKHIFVRHSHLQ